MAYNFLGLVNDVCNKFNEVPLTSSTFSTATSGFYADAKNSVNSAIREINQDTFMWPFNYQVEEVTLSAGTNRYDYPSDAKWVDFNTFRIKRDNTLGNETRFLREGDYEEYLYNYLDDEYNTADTGIRSLPERVYRTPGQEFTIHPVPDKAYTLAYEYYTLSNDLELYDDVPSVPFQFRNVIRNGAFKYAYTFRSDYENAQLSEANFNNGLRDMRKTYVNRYEFMRDGRLERGLKGPHNPRTA